jgi:putative pyruvate formate lyase activating enzyme
MMQQIGFTPAYLHLDDETFAARVAALRALMSPCRLCPRRCGIDRAGGEVGACGIGPHPVVSSYGAHFGEERPLVGRGGSGTIFLTRCNLRCIYCQNYDISQLGDGQVCRLEDVARMMLEIQARGCHNINWVTPTHQVPMLVEALGMARREGLHLPIVYNCGGYESVEVLRLLDGLVDIYMPDAKYSDNEVGRRLSGVPDYWDRCREALTEMHRQVGDLDIGPDGIARRGLLVRHLVLPDGLAGTPQVMAFLASLSPNTYVNVMAQYHPTYRAREVPALLRPITRQEYREAVEAALASGLTRLDERAL